MMSLYLSAFVLFSLAVLSAADTGPEQNTNQDVYQATGQAPYISPEEIAESGLVGKGPQPYETGVGVYNGWFI